GDVVLRNKVENLSANLATLQRNLVSAEGQLADLEALEGQLRSQQARIVRAIVAGDALVDFEFVVCPRCGQTISGRSDDAKHCTLCLQPSPSPEDQSALEAERDRLEEQIVDTLDLIDMRKKTIDELRQAIPDAEGRRVAAGQELNDVMASFVSDQQAEIARISAERARIQVEIEKFQ